MTSTRKQDPKYGDWSGTRRSMSYGQLPTEAEFKRAYREELGSDEYRIRNDEKYGDLDLNERTLWTFLKKLVYQFNHGSDGSGDLASGILSTLGFEWI